MKIILAALLIGTALSAQPVEPIDSFALAPIPSYPTIQISVPDVITPNGDGINDTFMLTLQANQRVAMKVYSRWGNLVYQTNDYQNDYAPTDLSDGVYAFHVRVYEGSMYRDFNKMITIIK